MRGVKILSVTTAPSAWSGTRALAQPGVVIGTAIGIHPQIAQERAREMSTFADTLPRTAFVGEVGLDGSRALRSSWDAQVAVFREVLKGCKDVGGRLISLHARSASNHVADLLSLHPGHGVPIVHWYSGNRATLQRLAELGAWFSVGPAMLAGEKGRELASLMPRDRVVLESDAPFGVLRGSPLLPWSIELAIPQLSEVWGVSRDDALGTVEANEARLLSPWA